LGKAPAYKTRKGYDPGITPRLPNQRGAIIFLGNMDTMRLGAFFTRTTKTKPRPGVGSEGGGEQTPLTKGKDTSKG